MATKVTGDLYESLDAKLFEIKRQIRQIGGYPFEPENLNRFLQRAVEGRFNDGQCWTEKDGVIYFSVTSDGTTGEQWIARLEKKGFRFRDYAKSVLRSPGFKPTRGVTTEITVLKGVLFSESDRVTHKIRAEAERRNLTKPNAEVACLIRERFTDDEIEAMGLWYVVAMHEPIKDSDGDPRLLCAGRNGDGRWLGACDGGSGGNWGRDGGFACAVCK